MSPIRQPISVTVILKPWITLSCRGLKGDLAPLILLSQVDFEAAAQSLMTETLREVKRLRPKALWGVSPYPSCSSGDPAQTMLANYTGQCPAAEMALNDELLWLWKRCSALYPLLSLEKLQVGHMSLLSLCVSFHIFDFRLRCFVIRITIRQSRENCIAQ